jgi:hypothetical protein
MNVTEMLSEEQKGAIEFVRFTRPKQVIVITISQEDEIQAQAFGDMKKSELIGAFEMAKLIAMDEVQ